MKSKKKHEKKILSAALGLIRDPRFLWRVVQKIGEMGIVGEQKNGLALYLAALTKDFDKPVSILEKGESSTGKSELIKAVISLLPPESVIARASLSKMAPVHGPGGLSGKVLFIAEYGGAKDVLYLTRLLQSEGRIDHEFAFAVGKVRGTVVASRQGIPVVFTTTTEDRVFQDDETRFLSIQADDSAKQTQQVINAYFSPEPKQCSGEALPVWHEALRILSKNIPKFRHPEWFAFLAAQIPPDEPRARRDGVRFLSLLKAVALCRSHSDGRIGKSGNEIEINFADYCVAHRILNRAFTSTFAGAHPNALAVARIVRRLNKQLDRPVSVKEIVEELSWDQPLVYKYVKQAAEEKLIEYEPGTHRWNEKRLLPGLVPRSSFLPEPALILEKCAGIGDEVRYVDPLNGKEVLLTRND
jgi:hypothetical protein